MRERTSDRGGESTRENERVHERDYERERVRESEMGIWSVHSKNCG